LYTLNTRQQAAESRRQIRDALLALMETVPFEEITITQICRQANVARQTYYRNFELKSDIFAFHLDTLFQQFFESCYRGGDMEAELLGFFDFMLKQRRLLLLSAQNGLFHWFSQSIVQNIPQFLSVSEVIHLADPGEERYVTGFIASTVSSLLSLWAERGLAESPAWMAGIANRFLRGLQPADPTLPVNRPTEAR